MCSSEWGTYAYFSFLTEDTLVIPNLLQNNLEIMRIVVDKSDNNVPRLVPLCTLNLPPLAKHTSIICLSCRAKPNLTGSAHDPLLVPAPNTHPFRDTTAEAIVLFNLLIEYMNIHAVQFFHVTHPFTFIVHRRTLLSHIPHSQQACTPFHSVLGEAPMTVLWSAWGVPITRWFESDQVSIQWITTTAGQRTVTMEDRSPISPCLADAYVIDRPADA